MVAATLYPMVDSMIIGGVPIKPSFYQPLMHIKRLNYDTILFGQSSEKSSNLIKNKLTINERIVFMRCNPDKFHKTNQFKGNKKARKENLCELWSISNERSA